MFLQHVSPNRRGGPEFDIKSVHVDLAPNQVALEQVCLSVLRFSSVITIPPMFRTNFQVNILIRRKILFG